MNRVLTGTVAAALLVAACGPAAPVNPPQASAGPRVVTINADDQLRFSPTELTVTKGETVVFKVVNVGTAAEHEFMIGPKDAVYADSEEGTAEIEGIDPGKTEEISYTFPEAGTFAFACHVAGHFEAGMLGAITALP